MRDGELHATRANGAPAVAAFPIRERRQRVGSFGLVAGSIRAMAAQRYLGGLDRLAALADSLSGMSAFCATSALAIAPELAPLLSRTARRSGRSAARNFSNATIETIAIGAVALARR